MTLGPGYGAIAFNHHLDTTLLGGDATFVLARGGQPLAIASPPGTKRPSYRTSTSTVPDEWLKDSTDNPGSWWENWHDWIEKRAPAS